MESVSSVSPAEDLRWSFRGTIDEEEEGTKGAGVRSVPKGLLEPLSVAVEFGKISASEEGREEEEEEAEEGEAIVIPPVLVAAVVVGFVGFVTDDEEDEDEKEEEEEEEEVRS